MARPSQQVPVLLNQAKIAGTELSNLAVQAGKVNSAFRSVVGEIPVIGTAARYVGDVLAVAREIGQFAIELPNLLSGNFGKATAALNAPQTQPQLGITPKPPSTAELATTKYDLPKEVNLIHPLPLPVMLESNVFEISHPLPLPVEVVNFPGKEGEAPYAGSVSKGQTPLASSTPPVPTLEKQEVPTLELAESSGMSIAGIALIGAAALVAGKAIEDMGRKAFAFAALANPASMERFNRAVMDAEAVIGSRFVPLVNLATVAVRAIGDSLVEMLPSTEDVRAALNEAQPAIDELRNAAHDLAPIVKDTLVGALKQASAELRLFAETVKILNETGAFGGPLSLFRNQNAPASSFGAAGGNVQFGNIEDVSRKIFEASVAQGMDKAPATESTIDKILQFLLKNGNLDPVSIGMAVAAAIGDKIDPDKFADALKKALKGMVPRFNLPFR